LSPYKREKKNPPEGGGAAPSKGKGVLSRRDMKVRGGNLSCSRKGSESSRGEGEGGRDKHQPSEKRAPNSEGKKHIKKKRGEVAVTDFQT